MPRSGPPKYSNEVMAPTVIRKREQVMRIEQRYLHPGDAIVQRVAPDRRKQRAVLAFISTSPGNTPLRKPMSNVHPSRTAKPRTPTPAPQARVIRGGHFD